MARRTQEMQEKKNKQIAEKEQRVADLTRERAAITDEFNRANPDAGRDGIFSQAFNGHPIRIRFDDVDVRLERAKNDLRDFINREDYSQVDMHPFRRIGGQ